MTDPYGAAAPLDEAERAAALDRLRRGYDDGWLSADEHELRATLARRARTRAELDRAVHSPSPEDGAGPLPHPISPVPPMSPVPPLSRPGSETGGFTATGDNAVGGEPVKAVKGRGDVESASGRNGYGMVVLPRRVAAGLQTFAWLGAVAAFFSTGQWWWFLLIPAMGAVVGSGASEEDWEERRRRRRARRDARRIRRGRPPIPGEVVRREDDPDSLG